MSQKEAKKKTVHHNLTQQIYNLDDTDENMPEMSN